MRILPHRYVQVRLGNAHLYCFKCLNAAVGDTVLVRTSMWPDDDQVVKVVKLGRNLYPGRIKPVKQLWRRTP